MRDISQKFSTLRTASAATHVRCSPSSIDRIKAGTVPKGHVLELSRAAALSGIKRCDELVPFCHSIALDWAELTFSLEESAVQIVCSTKAVARTGVEIEAMLGAQLAALNIYDLLKPIDEHLEIGPTRLLQKTGGYQSFSDEFNRRIKAAVLVASDSTAAGKRSDKSGRLVQERLTREGCDVIGLSILPDDAKAIENWFREQVAAGVDLVMSSGGSGLGPRDVTVEAAKAVIEREVPGISESMRCYGRERTPFAMLSRGVAGVSQRTLIVCLPGSSRGVAESLDALFPGLLHAFPMIHGGGHLA
jgi:molybdenum cofactor biosynthesis protein MoaC